MSHDGKTSLEAVTFEVGVDAMGIAFSGLTPNTAYLIRVFAGVDIDDYDSLYAEVKQNTVSEPLQHATVYSATSSSITFEIELTDGTTGIMVKFLNGAAGKVTEIGFITEFKSVVGTPGGRRNGKSSYGVLSGLLPKRVLYGIGDDISWWYWKYRDRHGTHDDSVCCYWICRNGRRECSEFHVDITQEQDSLEFMYKISRLDMEMIFQDEHSEIVGNWFEFGGLLAGVEYSFQIFVCVPIQTPIIIVSTDSFACPKISEDHTTWDSITSGAQQTGVCDTHYIGTPTRYCDAALGT